MCLLLRYQRRTDDRLLSCDLPVPALPDPSPFGEGAAKDRALRRYFLASAAGAVLQAAFAAAYFASSHITVFGMSATQSTWPQSSVSFRLVVTASVSGWPAVRRPCWETA